ncbi:2-amino-4-hydroxy-6-hydroxymethyldihydropteridine diphosphokinase [Actinomyces ruminicola]|uniref:Bifunctional folate synthesis protein n=1 Tax=Actinomyces ruminicola TaxID=332524 RepID=A0A1G9RKL9_9ACTO|nr:2-amino-4-hydroxy-6-hydroxymethyldihydropteridine diphosphokinase [Actinomyces ruminicola]SDM23796.1 dihydroneopterin aldolase / 2-amino-4-hydroxy-6-hydroxymethyldihydropteridine diphosphokinase [Actinomyces ruminicola]
MSTNHATPDRITLTGLSARGYHGLLPFERTEGQLFTADITVFLGERGTAVAAVTDSVTDAVNYADVAQAVVGIIEGEPVGLIETLAERISDAVLAFPRVTAVEVTVHKPQAPLNVAFDDVSVSIFRDADSAAESAARPAPAVDALVGAQPAPTAEPAPALPQPEVSAPPAPAVPLADAQVGPVAAVQQPEAAPPTATPEAPAAAPVSEPFAAPAPPAPQPPVDPLTVRPQAPAELVIALGGNVGGVVPALRTAVNTLRQAEGITVTAVAPLARTAAVVTDGEEQPDYLNTVVLATTTLSPREVLAMCQDLEAAAGRVRTRPQGPRTLDADIITYEAVTSTDPELTLPHPRAAQRAFVLTPWAQADPFAEIGDQSVAALAEVAPDRDGVRWLALDWLDSDHLPALPTGQYVAPPEPADAPAAGAAEADAASAEGAAQPSQAEPVEPARPSRAEAAAPVPAPDPEPVQAQEEPQAGLGQSSARHVAEPPASAPVAEPVPPAVPGMSNGAAASGADDDGDDSVWAAPPNWNDVIGRNGQGL